MEFSEQEKKFIDTAKECLKTFELTTEDYKGDRTLIRIQNKNDPTDNHILVVWDNHLGLFLNKIQKET